MALKVELSVRNMEATQRLTDYVEKKVSKLDRFLNDIDETRVELAHNKTARSAADRMVAQVTIRGKRYILRAEERADDIFRAIDASLEKMQRQIERFKGKRQRGRGNGLSAAMVTEAGQEAEETSEAPVIARRKTFTLIPMDEGEAIEQMNLLGHESFFVFYNANTNAVNILYRRRDGTYGLIEPTIG